MRARFSFIASSVVAILAACSSSPSGAPAPEDVPLGDAGEKPDASLPDAADEADAGSDAGPKGDNGPGGAFRSYAENGASGLRDLYNLSSGLYPSTGWWNSANAVTAMIGYSARTGSITYVGDIAVTFDKNKGDNFLNEYYDDEGWWALAWIDAFDLTKDPRYLGMAKTIFGDMVGGWDDTCSGGIWWKKDRKYKNAIANELFLEIAIRLHQRTPGDGGPGSYIDWAKREWVWFDKSGMINAENLVNDGLDTCKNNGQTTWTYNQGVLLGGLVELAKVTGDSSLLDRADSIAAATMAKLVDDQGVLREPCEPSCDKDQWSFKGIFMRNFATLLAARPSVEKDRFIAHNADWAWNAARGNGAGAQTRIGLQWSQALDGDDAARQASALDLLNAAIPYDAPQLNLALGRPVKSSALCSGNEGGSLSVDGKVSTKWCGSPSATPSWLEIDLGEGATVGRVVLRHAGAGGENSAWNTKDFRLQASDDAATWSDVGVVTSNKRSVTIHRVYPAKATRYLRLEVTAPQTGSETVATRIPEIEVYAR